MAEKKKYHYEVATIRLPNGKRKYVRGKTKAELAAKVLALQSELNLGIDITNDITVKDYADFWLRVARGPYVTKQTMYALECKLRLHVYPAIGSMPIRDVRATHILQVMSEVSGFSRGYQGSILALVRAIFDAAVDDNLILRSPVSKKLKAHGEDAPEVVPLTPEQEKEVLAAAEGLAVYPFVIIALNTGLRRGEICGLMWNDVDFDHYVIHVRRHVITDTKGKTELVDGAKTKAGVRYVPMTEALEKYLRERHAKATSVFVCPNSNGTVYSNAAVGKLITILNKRLPYKVHMHLFRHTYVTKLVSSRMLDIKQIQFFAGHANPDITVGTYSHFLADARCAESVGQVREALG